MSEEAAKRLEQWGEGVRLLLSAMPESRDFLRGYAKTLMGEVGLPTTRPENRSEKSGRI